LTPKKATAGAVVRLAAVTNATIDPPKIAAYVDILGSEPVPALIRAFELAERACTWFPSPAELLKLAGRSPEQLEEQEIACVWSFVRDYIAKHRVHGMPRSERVQPKDCGECRDGWRVSKTGNSVKRCPCTECRVAPAPEIPATIKAALGEIGGLQAVRDTTPEFQLRLRDAFTDFGNQNSLRNKS